MKMDEGLENDTNLYFNSENENSYPYDDENYASDSKESEWSNNSYLHCTEFQEYQDVDANSDRDGNNITFASDSSSETSDSAAIDEDNHKAESATIYETDEEEFMTPDERRSNDTQVYKYLYYHFLYFKN